MSSIAEYLEENAKRFESELCELLRIPSVSAESAHKGDVAQAADWMKNRFESLGFEAELLQVGEGHPIVYAESPPVEGAPTVLVYGHYDVQPPDPLDLWISPPFEPTVRNGSLFARGATDDKGQMLTHFFSAQAWLEVRDRLPVNLKYVIEGEEEVGSGSLETLLEESPERLECDCIVVSDTSQFAPGQPSITYGLRGIVAFELKLTGPNTDLHSGTFGGAVTNPANALAKMIASLADEGGRVTIPGFYDDILPMSEAEQNQLALLPFEEKQFFASVGVEDAFGESGFTTLERRTSRPTLDINGITSGYQGEGTKTIIPSWASAKITCRLVPEQDPVKIGEALQEMLDEACPPGIKLELDRGHASQGVVVPLESPYIEAAASAIEYAFGRSPVFTREGGSIPIIAAMHRKLGADVLLVGWGQNDDNLHAPNEKFNLVDFHRGIKASARLWRELSKIDLEG